MNPSHPPVRIGVDLGGTKIEVIVLDAAHRELWRRRVPTPQGDYAATLNAVASLVETAESALAIGPCRVGVGAPGSSNPDGTLKNANSTCLNGKPLQADLARRLGRPVRVANDANCLALSEASDGAGAGADVVFAAILGTGVGAGLVVGGRLLHGPNGLAGEWGHNPLPWAGGDDVPPVRCYCGQTGCIETWLSGPALARDHALHLRRAAGTAGAAQTDLPADAAAVAARADQGDAACEATLQRYESRLARALAGVINLLDPDVIVLGGGLSRMHRLFANVPARWGAHVFGAGATDAPRTRLVPSAHGDSSGVRGAAWLWPLD